VITSFIFQILEKSYCTSTRTAVIHITLPIMVYSQRDAALTFEPPPVLISTRLVTRSPKHPVTEKTFERFPKRFRKAKKTRFSTLRSQIGP
jgi:hypothetical protein